MHIYIPSVSLQVNKLSAALEDMSDEAVLLRRKAGLPPDEPLDTAGIKLQKDIAIAQLRSVNALLERQVWVINHDRLEQNVDRGQPVCVQPPLGVRRYIQVARIPTGLVTQVACTNTDVESCQNERARRHKLLLS